SYRLSFCETMTTAELADKENDIVQAAIQDGIFEFPQPGALDLEDYVIPRALATKAIELYAEQLGRKKVSTTTLFERLKSYNGKITEKYGTWKDGRRKPLWVGVRLGEAAYELTRIRHVPDAKTGELVVITSHLMDEYEMEIQKAAKAVEKRWNAR
ncbi:MAG: hypothetical protein K6T31_07410, partial [Alicyclobacillus sp.]|nr:hypothetical protein [Alicyclobacillus sp.]